MLNLRKLVKPYRDAGAQHALYAPHRFIDGQVFLTKGNALGVVLSVEGIDPECLTDETVECYTKRAAQAWRAFDERFTIYQYVVKQDRAEIGVSADATTEARRKHLESKAAGLYTLRIFYVLLLDCGNPVKRFALSTKNTLHSLATNLDSHRSALMAHAVAFQRNMDDLLGIEIADKQRAFAFFRLLANLDPATAKAERLKHDAHVDYFMSSLPLTCAEDGLRVGSADVEVLAMREPPSGTFPNVLKDLLSIQANFILCTEFRRTLNDKAITTIRAAQTHFHWSQWVSDIPSIVSMIMNRGNRENVIADKSALNDVEDLDETLKRINNQGEYLGEFSFTALLYGWNGRQKLQNAASDVAKIFGNHESSLIRETYNALNAYLAVIPGNTAFNLRKTWLLSGNYADLSFLYAPAAGDARNEHLNAEYLVALETNEATPYYFNLHEGDRFGVLITGAPRQGKSVLANLCIDHSQKYSPRTFILDLGGSYRAITRKHGGSYLEMQFGDGRQSFRINPFILDDTKDNIQFLFSFIRLLLTNGGCAPSAADDRELHDAIEGMYVLDIEHRTLSNLALGLPPHLKPYMHAWVGRGQYGSIFDNVEDTLTFAHFQTYDFQGMDEKYPQVLEAMLFYIFHRISQVVYDPALMSVPKQLWADETWRFLSHGVAKDYLMAAGATWGKHNAGVALITQSMEHFKNAGVMDLIKELCPTTILLPNPGAKHAEYQKVFGLNDKEVELFAGLIPKQQFLWKTAERSKLLNVDLDPQAFWSYVNSPNENARRSAAFEEHGFEKGLEVLASEAR